MEGIGSAAECNIYPVSNPKPYTLKMLYSAAGLMPSILAYPHLQYEDDNSRQDNRV